jgi:FecR-like protein
MSDPRDGSEDDAALDAFWRRIDWEAWPAPVPPAGFAQRVAAELPRLKAASLASASRPRWRFVALAAALAAALCAGWLLLGPDSAGHVLASERREVELGRRALAVLEAGAELRWRGPRVTQTSGAVFYRVEPGELFRVETPGGAVEVLGTCFSVALEPGAGKASMRVGVYEGRVRVVAGQASLELSAGGSAEADADGLRRGGALALGAAGSAAQSAPSPSSAGVAGAGAAAPERALEDELTRLRAELSALRIERSALDARVERAQRELARVEGAPPARHPYDLTADDWKELAQAGRVKFRLPCARPDFAVSAELAERLGLAPDDAPIIERAYAASRDRVWRVVRPLCIAELGSAAIADRIDRQGCEMVILESQAHRDAAAKDAAMRDVAEMRAGLRPLPGPGAALHPVVEMLLALTGEQARFEAELAEALGPEDARRIAFDDQMCHERLTLD